MVTCGELMTKDPVCCLQTESVYRAAQLMRDRNIGPILVVDGDKKALVGIVTDRDLAVRVMAEGRAEAKLVDVMTSAPLVCRESDDVELALDAMVDAKVRRIPVVDDRDRPVGIISQADVAIRASGPRTTGEVVEAISWPETN